MARILIVEDDADQLEIRSLLLTQAGHQVVAAGSVDQALERLDPPPDAAVIDLSLPRPEDGRLLLRMLRERAPATAMVVLTGQAEALEGQPERALVRAVLQKPSPTRQLLETLNRLLASRAAGLLAVSAVWLLLASRAA